MTTERSIGGGLIVGIAVLVSLGLWQTATQRAGRRIAVVSRPQKVMGTSCALVAVVGARAREKADQALRESEAALRGVEARMSVWLEDSEVSRLNRALAGVEVPLSPETLHVLKAANEACPRTAGAFDVTCRPLVDLWRQAAQRGVLPTESERAHARAASNWERIELTDTGAVKRTEGASIDLGGIAKGYAIDRALGVLKRAEAAGGLVDVGGDLACFGEQAGGAPWLVDVKNPFGEGRLAQLCVTGGAVCTSGPYARPVEIAGRRYSHVIDPRDGHPAGVAASVTVVAPEAMLADLWATALGVLGAEGLDLLPDRVEALLVVGSESDCRIVCTGGFRDLIKEPLPEGLRVR